MTDTTFKATAAARELTIDEIDAVSGAGAIRGWTVAGQAGAGAAIGGMIGGGLGSAIPGAGTVAGAGVGSAIGAAAGAIYEIVKECME